MPTVTQLQERVLHRLGEDPSAPVHYTAAEVLRALNEAQRTFAFFTLCLEKKSTFALPADTAFHNPTTNITDFIVPLLVRIQGGARVYPSTIEDLNARRYEWQKVSGQPDHYACPAPALLAITKQPDSIGTTLEITHAHEPADLTSGGQTPEIPVEYHHSMADAAVHLCRIKEGGAEFSSTFALWNSFLEDVRQCAYYIRERSKRLGYDRLPVELRAADGALPLGAAR